MEKVTFWLQGTTWCINETRTDQSDETTYTLHLHTDKNIHAVYLHWTISSTTASRGFTLNPLYWLVWQRYEPVISLDTLTIRSTPS